MNKVIIFISAIAMSAFVSTSSHAADEYYGKFPSFGWKTITCVEAKDYYDNMDSYEQGFIDMLEDKADDNGWSVTKLNKRIVKANTAYESLKEKMYVKYNSIRDDNTGRCTDYHTN